MSWATIAARNADLPQQPNIPVVETPLGQCRRDVLNKEEEEKAARKRKIEKMRRYARRTAVQVGRVDNPYDWAEKNLCR